MLDGRDDTEEDEDSTDIEDDVGSLKDFIVNDSDERHDEDEVDIETDGSDDSGVFFGTGEMKDISKAQHWLDEDDESEVHCVGRSVKKSDEHPKRRVILEDDSESDGNVSRGPRENCHAGHGDHPGSNIRANITVFTGNGFDVADLDWIRPWIKSLSSSGC
jgi:hypothetical protein